MDWNLILAQIIAGVATGALYFLVASGLTLLWGALDVINLAHGSFFMLAAYSATSFIQKWGVGAGYLAALFIVPIAISILAVVIEVVLFRRVYRHGVWGQLLISFGLVLVIADLVRTFFGANARSVQAPSLFTGFVQLGGIRIAKYQFVILLMSLLVGLLLWLILNRSRVGLLIRATVDDPGMLSAMGVNVNTLRTLVMALSAFLAALAGVVAAPRGSINGSLDVQMVLIAFAVTVIGGLGSVWGALIAAVAIGIIEAVSTVFINAGSGSVIFVVMVVMLAIRPTGLNTIVGRKGQED